MLQKSSFVATFYIISLFSKFLGEADVYGSITPYFSPNGGITQTIINEISTAQSNILVQAYSFTSIPIAEALANAHKRGISVTVILDKSNRTSRHSASKFLLSQGVNTLIDWKPAIAHNKIIIIDYSTVITGSFNFTKAAEQKNTENIIILKEEPLAAESYVNYFSERMSQSEKFQPSTQ